MLDNVVALRPARGRRKKEWKLPKNKVVPPAPEGSVTLPEPLALALYKLSRPSGARVSMDDQGIYFDVRVRWSGRRDLARALSSVLAGGPS